MKYKQSVLVKNVSMKSARTAFNNVAFLKHLITLQPVKIMVWEGTYDGALAHMRFWFLGWKDFMVQHKNNSQLKNSFSFKDQGTVLPFRLTKWTHSHKVIKRGENIEILDEIYFDGDKKILALMFYPILIAPIFFRKILYKTYNWQI